MHSIYLTAAEALKVKEPYMTCLYMYYVSINTLQHIHVLYMVMYSTHIPGSPQHI